MPYPSELAVALRNHLQPDGTGRLLDIGCGPGGFTLAVAGLFAEVVGADPDGGPRPQPPYDGMSALVAKYLGPERRAGRGTLPNGTLGGEDLFYRDAGFTGPERIVVGGGEVVERTEDQVVAGLLSLSSSTPALFGPRLPLFEGDLRALLRETAPNGLFAERRVEAAIDVWSR
jgi:hypothetical protein